MTPLIFILIAIVLLILITLTGLLLFNSKNK